MVAFALAFVGLGALIGYTPSDAGARQVTKTRTVTKEVPGPTRVVEVPGKTTVVERSVTPSACTEAIDYAREAAGYITDAMGEAANVIDAQSRGLQIAAEALGDPFNADQYVGEVSGLTDDIRASTDNLNGMKGDLSAAVDNFNAAAADCD
jgi:hypothetical protein